MAIYCRITGGKSPGTNNNSYERCFKCHADIGPNDLVMKAKQSLFHVDCFRCARCGCLLKKGDLFGMPPDRDDVVYCQYHFYQEGTARVEVGQHSPEFNQPAYSNPPPPTHHAPFGGYHQHTLPMLPKEGEPAYEEGYPHYPPPHPMVPPYGGYPHPPPKEEMGEGWYGGEGGPPEGHFFDGGSGSEEGKTEVGKKKRGRKKRRLPPAAAMEDDDSFPADMYNHASAAAAAAAAWMEYQGGMGNKSKRARTSFKHNQLRIMRSHFQINQNPDSRELKMLSQKTGLDKKVLQVWFQNSRAKWRRSQSEGGGGSGPAAAAAGNDAVPPPPMTTTPPMTSPPDQSHHPTGIEGTTANQEQHHQQSFPQEHFRQL